MKVNQCISVCVLVCVVNSAFAFPQGNSSSPPSLFSTALRASRLYDTSLQSSIIRLIRELMLTPKVYESMNNAIERRADSGRVLFPDEVQGRSASIMMASPSGRSLDISVPPTSPPSGLRSESLSSRVTESGSSTTGGYQNNPLLYEQNGIVRRVRMGKVERVPRPIIINGNYAALNAPRYNRMVEGPAPTVGGSATAIKIPPPSVIVSQPLRIIEGNRDSRGRSLKEIDVQGVRVIVGQRVPDDPEDKLFTWRNGRVIKGMFVPNDPSNARPVEQQVTNEISKPESLVISSSYAF